MFTVEQKIQHLRNLGFTGSLDEVEKMYKGEKFYALDANYQKLLSLSTDLCDEFTKLSAKLTNESQVVRDMASRRKTEILDILFPGHGLIFGGRDGLKAVIGMVNFEGFTYLNGPTTFTNSSMVNVGYYSWLGGQYSVIGNELKIDKNGMAKISFINVDKDTVVYAGSRVDDGVSIPKQCVVALGSHVTKDSKMQEGTLIISKRQDGVVMPANSIQKIEPNYKSKNMEIPFKRTEEEIKDIINFVKSLGIDGDFTEYKKSLCNITYNTLDPTIGKIFELTHNLCSEYNNGNPTPKRRQEILDIIFYKHGKNLEVGKELNVDIMGQVEIGDNVVIGDRVALNGNISIGNNVIIKNDVLLQSIGHFMYYKDRHLPEDGTMYEANTSGGIYICDNVVLANGTKVLPNARVNKNTEENQLVTRKKEIEKTEEGLKITL